jgi:hypothetical integral membrane protein (TIGR02206 family)
MDRFVLFGAHHLAALCLTALVAAVLVALARRAGPAGGLALRLLLGAALLLAAGGTLAYWYRRGLLELWDLLPFHLCDFLILVAAFTLVTRDRLAAELLFFWAGTGTLLAMLAPDLQSGFPSWPFVSFFLLHGLVVAAAAVATFGFGWRPRAGAGWRVFAMTNAYALLVGMVNAAFGTNYLFLRGKPAAPTLLDWFGPWPVYLFVAEAAALGLFLLLDRVFRAQRERCARGLAPTGGAR